MTGAVQLQPTTTRVQSTASTRAEQVRPTTCRPVGLNRNNTQGNATAATYQLANANVGGTAAQRRALYASCSARVETAILAGIDCGQQIYGTTPVAGTLSGFSSTRTTWNHTTTTIARHRAVSSPTPRDWRCATR